MTSTVEIDGQMVQITNGERENARAWFYYSNVDVADASRALSETKMKYYGLDESILSISRDIIRKSTRTTTRTIAAATPAPTVVNGDDTGTTTTTASANQEDNEESVGCYTFDGDDLPVAILGFSQGATMCHLLSALACKANQLKLSGVANKNGIDSIDNDNDKDNTIVVRAMSRIKCAILFSGFTAMHTDSDSDSVEDDRIKGGNEGEEGIAAEKNNSFTGLFGMELLDENFQLDLPSLHLFGEKDTSVPPLLSEKLSRQFRENVVYVHGKGHVIPQDVQSAEQLVSFLDSYCSAGN